MSLSQTTEQNGSPSVVEKPNANPATTEPNPNQRRTYFVLDIERTIRQVIREQGASATAWGVAAEVAERMPGLTPPFQDALREMVKAERNRERQRDKARERRQRRAEPGTN